MNCFLTHLAVQENVAALTQNQALAALLFLYQQVLGKPLHRMEGVVRARRPPASPPLARMGDPEGGPGGGRGVHSPRTGCGSLCAARQGGLSRPG